MSALSERSNLVEHPREPAEPLQPLDHDVIGLDEIAHVIEGVLELLLRERAARPIGERLAFGQRDSQEGMNEAVV